MTVTGKQAFQGGEHTGQRQQSGHKPAGLKHDGAHQSALLDEAATGRHSRGLMQEPHPNQDPSLRNCKLREKVFHLEESDALTHTVNDCSGSCGDKAYILMCRDVCDCGCVRVCVQRRDREKQQSDCQCLVF